MSITGVKVKLVGEDGNAYAIMGRVRNAMRRAKVDPQIIEEYSKKAMSGDYDNLLRVTMEYVDDEGEEQESEEEEE